MIAGLSLSTYTLVHVIISLIGIASGIVVLLGLLTSRPFNGWTALFLTTTLFTCVTGFGFPFQKVLPSHIVGTISLVVLAIAIVGRYVRHLAGAWRWVYAVSAVIALYLNVFVTVVQAFDKTPALKVLAPTQTEAPFTITQLVILLLFVVLGALAVKRFHEPARASALL